MSMYTRLSRIVNPSLLREPLPFLKTRTFLLIQVPRRTMNVIKGKPFVGKKSLSNFHTKDGIPNSYTLVYRTNFPNYFVSAQAFVLLSIGAFVSVGIASLIEFKMKEEDKINKLEIVKAERILAEKASSLEKERIMEMILKTPKDEEVPTPVPLLSDLVEKDLDIFLVCLSSLVIIAGTIFKILRLMPVRVYVGKKKHCIAINYGSLLPGRTVQQEFVAGTLKERKSYGSGIWGNSLFRDGSGKDMVLLEQFFRQAADFNYLLGIQRQDEDYEVDGETSETDQMKESGAFAVKEFSQNDVKGKNGKIQKDN